MKKMYWIGIILTICINSSPLFASDLFSHVVLKLPFDLRSDEAWTRIIKSQEEWKILYNEIISDNLVFPSDAEPVPEIDFESYQLIAGGLGFRSHGGDQVVVESVYESDNSISVYALNIKSGDYCGKTAAIDFPSTAILIKKTEKTVNIFLSEIVNECPIE